MNKIAFAFIAAMAVLSFTGCKKKSGAGEAIAKMEGFKNEMCACKDKACADGVDKKMMDWGAANKPKDGKPMEMSKEEKDKSEAISKAMSDCRTKASPPAADPAMAPPAGDKPADPAMAPPAGDKPADPAATPPAGGDMKKEEPKKEEMKK
jgi:hypothetical protein